MSRKKFSNELSHSSQTRIPRPPYKGYFFILGFVHRAFIPRQARYSALCDFPCFVFAIFLAAVVSDDRHPHERVSPLLSRLDLTTLVCPQSQRTFQHDHLPRISAKLTTVRRPNLLPVRSMSAVTMSPFFPIVHRLTSAPTRAGRDIRHRHRQAPAMIPTACTRRTSAWPEGSGARRAGYRHLSA